MRFELNIILITLAGGLAGFCLNYLADVLPVYRRFTHSICQDCHEPIGWKDYILFHACPYCGRQQWLRRGLIAAITPLLLVALYIFPSGRLTFWENAVILVFFLLVAIIDIEHRLIMHPVSLAGAVIGLVLGTRMHGIFPTLIGGAAGFLMMFVLYYLGGLFAKVLGKARGEEIEEIPLGFGDVNLSGVLGLLLGWPGIAAGLFFAILAGGVFSGGYILVLKLLRRYQPFSAIPYAPFLLLGTAILLFATK
ncbi:hypothetical protein ADN00_00315 [Ornatilinea apprima]|uniref:Prepilin type IV endopeptidase peptidase domain-containing protein n=1 Tax=Ornatilinea apprima TaxID=1134406 RepID=A0A0P6Y6G6_9CHLR|nr:prepilin peptidase [Ornatilinea apprima]KPL81025.1 hypothetical protein ADN00_00315 [Ornatilinea apprima]